MDKPATKKRNPSASTAEGRCLCGKVRFEIGVPARWTWYDHSKASRQAHGVTYVGCWKSRVRITKGATHIARFEHEQTRTTRDFCTSCGTPLFYERAHSPPMINIPRAVRHPRRPRTLYHIAIKQSPKWACRAKPLVPLKGSGVWERPRRKKRSDTEGLF
ncbi:MAG: GFA family protein [Alphaproteobacteria bacterium]|nr:GFA family protein [Alphaproteobacteria bacterium]